MTDDQADATTTAEPAPTDAGPGPDPRPGDGLAPLTPRERAKGQPRGIPVADEHGQEWLLPYAPTSEALDGFRETLYTDWKLEGTVARLTVNSVAFVLFRQAYNLSVMETYQIIAGMEPGALARAVGTSLITPMKDTHARTYSAWVRAGLWANGIDHRQLPGEAIHDVVWHLSQTGRMGAVEDFSEIAKYQQERREQLDQGEW